MEKNQIKEIVKKSVEDVWYNRRSINPVEEQTELLTESIHQSLNKFVVSNCPDLTDLWFQTNGKRQQGTITEDEAKQIYDALNTLERHNLCELKFGI